MSERARFVSARIQEEQRNRLIKFISTMKLIKMTKKMAKKKDVAYTQYLGTYGVIDHANEKLRLLGPINHQAEMVIADEEWRGENLKRKRDVFDEERGARPTKKMRVEIPQLIGKRRREEEVLSSDAPPAKKRRIGDLVAPKVKQHPLALPPSIPEPSGHGLVDSSHESFVFLKNFMVFFLLVLATSIWRLCLLVGGSASH
ncbi:unnamed protein product [Rhizopus stolonifer]